MLARALGRSEGTYLITEHSNKATIPEETNTVPDQQFWIDTFHVEAPFQEVRYDEAAFRQIDHSWQTQSAGKRLLLKNPSNVVRAREIRRAFPNARFIWLIRNPWAVMQSMLGSHSAWRKNPQFLGATHIAQLTDPLQKVAASWAYFAEAMSELTSPLDVTTRYEELITNPGSELARIASSLSIPLRDDSSQVPLFRPSDFDLITYAVRRSDKKAEILNLVKPYAEQFGYPVEPTSAWTNQMRLTSRFFLYWCKNPRRAPPHLVPKIPLFGPLPSRPRPVKKKEKTTLQLK
jgi:hypothetical protein